MDGRKHPRSGRFARFLLALTLSLAAHLFLLIAGSFVLGRGRAGDGPAPAVLSVAIARRPEAASPRTEAPSPVPAEPAPSRRVPDSPGDEASGGENPFAGAEAPEAPVVPPWEVDVPPALTAPGSIGDEEDFSSLIDSLPLTASVYLDETGRPFLVLYEPMPKGDAVRRLNGFIATSSFSPAMVGDRPVPSVLALPLAVKGAPAG